MKNTKGFTLFEVLVAISVGSILIVTLMSLLTTVLLTRNQVDYTNRLDFAVYEVNQTMADRFERLGYKSILDLVEQEMVTAAAGDYVFLLTREYEMAVDGEGMIQPTQEGYKEEYILLLDIAADNLYLGPRDAFILEGMLDNPETDTRENHIISSPRMNFYAGSTITLTCLENHNPSIASVIDLNSDCAHAFLEFDLEISYTLANGNALSPKRYVSTLFY